MSTSLSQLIIHHHFSTTSSSQPFDTFTGIDLLVVSIRFHFSSMFILIVPDWVCLGIGREHLVWGTYVRTTTMATNKAKLFSLLLYCACNSSIRIWEAAAIGVWSTRADTIRMAGKWLHFWQMYQIREHCRGGLEGGNVVSDLRISNLGSRKNVLIVVVTMYELYSKSIETEAPFTKIEKKFLKNKLHRPFGIYNVYFISRTFFFDIIRNCFVIFLLMACISSNLTFEINFQETPKRYTFSRNIKKLHIFKKHQKDARKRYTFPEAQKRCALKKKHHKDAHFQDVLLID